MSKATKIITRPDLKSFVGAIQNAVRDGWQMDPFAHVGVLNGSFTVTLEQEISPVVKVKEAPKKSAAVNCGDLNRPTLQPGSWRDKFDNGM